MRKKLSGTLCKLGQYVIINFIIDVVFVDPKWSHYLSYGRVFSIECNCLLWNICVCCWTALPWAGLSLIILYWWRNHFTIICLRYFRIWRRGQKDCAIWEETTQLFVQNPLFRFLILLFGNIPDAQSHCMLYFSVEVRQIERECGDLLDPV